MKLTILLVLYTSIILGLITSCGSSNDIKNIETSEKNKTLKYVDNCNDNDKRCLLIHEYDYCSRLYKVCINNIHSGK